MSPLPAPAPAPTRLAWLGIGLLTVVGPWWADASLRASLADTAAPRSTDRQRFDIDLDATGFEFGPATLTRSGITARAGRTRVQATWRGIEVDITALRVSAMSGPQRPHVPAPARTPVPAIEASRRAGTRAEVRPHATTLPDLPIPILVHTHGRATVAGWHPITMTAINPSFTLHPGRRWQTEGSAEVTWAGHRVATIDAFAAAGTADGLEFTASVRPVQQTEAVELAGRHAHGRVSVTARTGDGVLKTTIVREESRTAYQAHVTADQFPLRSLYPTDIGLPRSLLRSIRDAHLSGSFRARLAGTELDLIFEGTTIERAAIEHRALASGPVEFGKVGLEGTLHWDTHNLSGRLDLSHDGIAVHTEGTLDASQLELAVTLEPTSCQRLIDATPASLVPLLAGMRAEGHMTARFQLAFPLAAIRRAPPDDEEPHPAAGILDVDLPFLDNCRITADPPDVDLAALAGPYRHRFVLADGGATSRVMGIESPSFTPLNRIPHIGRAFVILEDAQFWTHDGFDRDQMARAFWHNLGRGRISRGASTITQQTARNLWLGGQRTLSRKLQEAVLASRLERSLPKKRILELYLNVIELGPGIHGVRDAARYHFGRHPKDLNLLQALHLAALAPAPVTLSRKWASGKTNAAWRRNLRDQIRRLRRHGMITRQAEAEGLRATLQLRAHTESNRRPVGDP